MLEESLELGNVMSVLSGQSEYKGNYRINDRDGIHYYQFRFIKNEDSGIIVLGFLNVDDVVESEIRHQKLLKEALDTAERANAEKSNFLSRMSHDMRTPLNGIIGLLEIDKKHENDIGFLKSNREKAFISASHLLSLINDVLDMSKIEAGKMKLTLEEENMDEIIENIDALVRPQMVLRRQKFEIIVELLKMEGAECTVCENGQLAVETFTASEENTINLLLMDVQMPVMNGYEATKAIPSSGHPMAETIPIIAMTANAFVEDIHDALDTGMNAHVAKPVDMQVLKETVAQVIGGRA